MIESRRLSDKLVDSRRFFSREKQQAKVEADIGDAAMSRVSALSRWLLTGSIVHRSGSGHADS